MPLDSKDGDLENKFYGGGEEDSSREVIVPLDRAVEERYLAYALSTIVSRSLPDVRDGLKPVHRRILWAMKGLGLSSSSPFKKSARVVGDVIGKFHPHGDQAAYEALVRMAQNFVMRYPLVEGQGNFGNIDGDNAAAMRYTECRLTDFSELLLSGVDEGAVNFRPTYDGSNKEPEVLPAAFPNVLANGSSGIAVGMATNIPPHNLGELLHALIFLLEEGGGGTKDLTDRLLSYVRGPDFPTGGVLVMSEQELIEAYRTGRGVLRVRAKWFVEKMARGQWQAVVSEIPYGVQKSSLLEQLNTLLEHKKLPEVEEIIDESDEKIRIVIAPRSRTVDPEKMMERIFSLSKMEIRISMNLNVLGKDQTPKVMGLQEILQAFLDHRRDVVLRQAIQKMDKIAERLEMIEAVYKAHTKLSTTFNIIKNSEFPKQELQKKLSLSERQAEYLMGVRLRTFGRVDISLLRQEREKLLREQADIRCLLSNKDKQNEALVSQFKALIEKGEKNSLLWDRRTSWQKIQTSPLIEGAPQAIQ